MNQFILKSRIVIIILDMLKTTGQIAYIYLSIISTTAIFYCLTMDFNCTFYC